MNITSGTKLTALLTSLLLSACADNHISQEQIQTQPPKTEKDLGLMIQATSTESLADFLNTYPEAKVRYIYKPQNRVELSNTTIEEIKAHFGDINISINTFVDAQNKKQKLELSLNLSNQNTLDQNVMNGAENPFNEFSDCQQITESPLVGISSNLPGLKNNTVAKKIKVGFNFKQTSRSSNLKSTLWFVQGPMTSKVNAKMSKTSKIDFSTDELGEYSVMLLAKKDIKGLTVCSQDFYEFSITSNEKLNPLNDSYIEITNKHIDIDGFSHLSDIDVKKAWAQSQGEGQVIAIIDSGVNYNHPFLRQNIFVNKNEIPDNGIDDDKNGYVDDVAGYDFANNDPYPFDDGGHGSHVAGLAAGHIFGVASKAKILPIKSMGPTRGDLGSILAGLYYAVDNGATVINMSLGGYSNVIPPEYTDAMNHALNKGVLVVAASGNGHPQTGEGLNTDAINNIPSALPHSNIISVASSAKGEELASYSNYGKVTVDVVAPGGSQEHQLFSSFYKNSQEELFIGMQGTSMASPVTAGVVALMQAKNPTLSFQKIKKALMETGTSKKSLQLKTKSGREISALRAVSAIDQVVELKLAQNN